MNRKDGPEAVRMKVMSHDCNILKGKGCAAFSIGRKETISQSLHIALSGTSL